MRIDADGKPRQRVIVNLYGAASPLGALAKLAAQRELLKAEKAELEPEIKDAADFYQRLTAASLDGRKFTKSVRKEFDQGLRARERLLKRAKKMDAALALIRKDGPIIKKHCDATPDEIQAAIRDYKKELADAEALVLGMEYGINRSKQALRYLAL